MAQPLQSADRGSDRPAWADASDNPYLRGIHAPICRELEASPLPVRGELPRDLSGAYVRNGPNPVFAPRNLYHWFDGDGMLHALTLRDGRASYRCRWIETRGLAEERRAGRSLWPGVMGPYDWSAPRPPLKDTANTDVVWHGGALLALWYLCGEPYRCDPLTLATLGTDDFGGRRSHSVSAHPKVDPRTGELVYFTLSDYEPPYMRYGVVSREGELVHEIPVELPGARAPHDITITEHFSILHDFPFFHDPALAKSHGVRVARFHRELPTRFGVVPRRGRTEQVLWFEFEPGYVLHMVNAWEDGDWITMDGCFQPDPSTRRNPAEGVLAGMLGYLRIRAHLHRWRMNLRTGETREQALDDLNVEFPLPDTELFGVRSRYSYHQYLPPDMQTVEFRALVKYDHESGAARRYDYEPGWFASESPFAGRPGARSEDDGFVLTFATEAASGRSECWIFSALEIERGPIARIELPARVPTGFHAKWIPGHRIFSGH